MEVFAANDQVMVKKQIRSGKLIRFGSIVKLDGDKALVHFPIDHSQAVIPVTQLEKTSGRFGSYSRVQPSPVMRSFTPQQLKNR